MQLQQFFLRDVFWQVLRILHRDEGISHSPEDKTNATKDGVSSIPDDLGTNSSAIKLTAKAHLMAPSNASNPASPLISPLRARTRRTQRHPARTPLAGSIPRCPRKRPRVPHRRQRHERMLPRSRRTLEVRPRIPSIAPRTITEGIRALLQHVSKQQDHKRCLLV